MVQKTLKTLLIIIVVAFMALAGYRALTLKDQRTTGEKMGDAVDAISDGAENAGRQLESRTPAEKLGDAVKDFGDDTKGNKSP